MLKCIRDNSGTIVWASCVTLLFLPDFEDIFDLLLDFSILAVSLSNTPTSHAVTYLTVNVLLFFPTKMSCLPSTVLLLRVFKKFR